MDKLKQTYTHQFSRRVNVEKTKIQYGSGDYRYQTTQETKWEVVTFDGSFSVEIDVEGIARRLCGTAAHAKTGKSTCMSGLVKAKLLVANPIARKVVTNPVDTTKYRVVED